VMTLVVARPDGSVVRRIADLRGDYRFSPAGDRIAVVTGTDMRSDVYDLTGSGQRAGLVSTMRLAWAPGASLAGIEYFLDHPEDSPDGTGAVCLAAADGGAPRRLVTFLGRTIGSGLHWSPRGEMLAFQVTR
jgi:Tol biopolymer transport system component